MAMADTQEATTPMETLNNTSDSESSDNEAPEPQVEWLATSRAKRSTAGTRMTSLIQQEAEDDELELLFAEDENDEGFEMEGGDDSDVQMDSSDDDDDQGPPAPGVEELDGEKELLRRERAERMGKKRKNDHLPKAFQAKNKKVKIHPMDPAAGKEIKEPRPKKKSERSSWIPTEVDAPVRVSHRSTTMQAKEELYKEMQKREELRLKQLANMEKAAAKKAAQKKPEKTQEDRLAEAARIEKANAKSLNRWEEAERIREEEARARLEALHNRKMEGPVITWWSGKATYVGDQLKQVGKIVEVVAPPVKVPRKKRPSEMGLGDSATAKARLERQQSLPKSAMQQHNGQNSRPSSGPGTALLPGFTNGLVATNGSQVPNHQTSLQPTQATPAMLNGSTPLSGLSAPPSAPASSFPQPQQASSAPSPSPLTIPQLPPPPPPPTSATPVASTLQNGTQVAGSASLPLPVAPTTTAAPQPLAQTSPQSAQATPSHNDLYYNNTPHNQPSANPSPAAQPSAGSMPPSQTSATSMPPPSGPSPGPLSIAPAAPQVNSPTPPQQIKCEPSHSMPPPSAFPVSQQHTQSTPSQSQGPHTSSAPPSLNISAALPQAPPAPPQPTTYATSNRLILSSFSEPSLRDKSVISAILFKGNRFQKLPRPTQPPMCAITGLPAKFKDPKTGLPYVNSYAFKEIRRLERGEYRWSGLVGAYVGGVDRPAVMLAGVPPTTVPGAARGVPERFTDPNAPPPPKVVKTEAVATPKSFGTPTGSMGPMAPPPLPGHNTGTPTPNGMGGQGRIMTPGQFAAQNPLNSPAQRICQPSLQNQSQGPKQPHHFMAAALNTAAPSQVAQQQQQPSNIPTQNKPSAPFGMQTQAPTPITAPMKAASQVVSASAAPAPPSPALAADVPAAVAPIASTMMTATTNVAAAAPAMAPAVPIGAPNVDVSAAAPPAMPAQPKA